MPGIPAGLVAVGVDGDDPAVPGSAAVIVTGRPSMAKMPSASTAHMA
jgi:hypothetical protein